MPVVNRTWLGSVLALTAPVALTWVLTWAPAVIDYTVLVTLPWPLLTGPGAPDTLL